MRKKEMTRRDVGVPQRAEAGAELVRGTTSHGQCTTAAGRQIRISDLLGYGPDRGLTLSDLRRLTNLNSRAIRLMIRDERMAGAQIVSDNVHGYYVTDDPDEVHRFAQSMRRRAREIVQVAAAVEKAAGRRDNG